MTTFYDAASHYDRVTPSWSLLLGDELHYGLFRDSQDDLATATASLTEAMADRASIDPGMRVLDVGCGTGAPACELASRYGAVVTGISTSLVGVEASRARAEAAGVSTVASFALVDGTCNSFTDASFDRVWVLESSHLMRRREQLLAECVRVLRPGGRMALCDIVLRRELPFLEVRTLRRPLGILREVFGDARMDPLDTYVDRLQGDGMLVRDVIDLTEATFPTFGRWRANAIEHQKEVEQALGAGQVERFVEACDILEGFWEDGTLGYGMVVADQPGSTTATSLRR